MPSDSVVVTCILTTKTFIKTLNHSSLNLQYNKPADSLAQNCVVETCILITKKLTK